MTKQQKQANKNHQIAKAIVKNCKPRFIAYESGQTTGFPCVLTTQPSKLHNKLYLLSMKSNGFDSKDQIHFNPIHIQNCAALTYDHDTTGNIHFTCISAIKMLAQQNGLTIKTIKKALKEYNELQPQHKIKDTIETPNNLEVLKTKGIDLTNNSSVIQLEKAAANEIKAMLSLIALAKHQQLNKEQIKGAIK